MFGKLRPSRALLYAVFVGLRERAKVIVGSAAMLVACATARIRRRLILGSSNEKNQISHAYTVTVIS